MYFGAKDDHLFAWLPSVPQGHVAAELSVGGHSEHLTGIGYHDHNWGDVAMSKLINHWYWGRAQAGPYSIVASYITAGKAYDNVDLPIFLLAKDGRIVADDASKVDFRLSDVHVDKASGKPVADTVVYEYRDGTEGYRVSFNRAETIVDNQFIDGIKGIKHVLAKLAHLDGSYLRFTGKVRLEHLSNSEAVEDVSDPGVWELMYFGHVEQQQEGLPRSSDRG